MSDRHRENYYREYYACSDKAKAKRKRQDEKKKAERHANAPRCRICGLPRFRSSMIGDRLNIHRHCDPAAWMREVRRQK